MLNSVHIGRLKENQAQFLFKQILDAIEYLHTEKSIVHRDLKVSSGSKKLICLFGI